MSHKSQPADSLDLRVFIPSMTVLCAVVAPLILFPESGPAMVNAAFSFATGQFGWLYMIAGLSAVLFLIALAASKYGNVRLGGPDDAPEFSYFSWIAMIFCGGIGIAIVNWAWVFFAVWGGYALDLQISGKLDVSAVLSAEGIPATVLAILNTMPMPQLVTVLFIVLCFIFLATTLDSAAYVLASVTSYKLSGYQEPKRWIRILWALILALVGIVLIQLGGLKPVQTSTIVVALPLIPVLLILTLSLMRWLKEDFGGQTRSEHLLVQEPENTALRAAATAPSID